MRDFKWPTHFCALPWVHFSSTTSGNVRLCCQALRAMSCDKDGRPLSLYQDSIEDIWNSPYYLSVRERLLKGDRLPECSMCYTEEESGGKSKRLSENEHWLNQDATLAKIKASQEKSYPVDLPVYLDLKLGNVCNLQCRMCNPKNSQKILKEWKAVEQELQFDEYFSPKIKLAEQIPPSGGSRIFFIKIF